MASQFSQLPDFPIPNLEAEQYEGESQNNIKRVRGPSFNIDEDQILISAWLNTGMDPVKGNDQKLGTFWERITEYYHMYKPMESERSQQMLTQRWGKIQKHVNKFSGCFSSINVRNESGKNEQDKIADAKKLFEAQENFRFNLEHAWISLRYQPKWIQLMRILNSKNINNKKRSKANIPSSSTVHTDVEEDNVSNIPNLLARPLGNKVEKRKLKESREQYVKIENLHEEKRERDEMKIAILKEKVEVDKEKLRVRKQEAEMRAMSINTSTMSEEQRKYYSQLQMKILQGGI